MPDGGRSAPDMRQVETCGKRRFVGAALFQLNFCYNGNRTYSCHVSCVMINMDQESEEVAGTSEWRFP